MLHVLFNSTVKSSENFEKNNFADFGIEAVM